MKRDNLIISFLILIVVFAFSAFYPITKNGFVNWDDGIYVTDNSAISSLSWDKAKDIFSSFYFGNYHPLTMLSYSLEFALFGADPFYYHLTNIILHILNSLLVFWFFYLLFKKAGLSLIVALLFGVHPLGTEAVAWVSARKELLYAFFFLGSLVAYLYYLREKKLSAPYFISLLLFIFSLLSKGMAITLPIALLIIDYLKGRKYGRVGLIEKIPFFALSFIFGIIAIMGQQSIGAIRREGVFDLLPKLAVASYAATFYLGKIILPVRLSALYPYAPVESGSVLIYAYTFLIFVVLAMAVVFSARFTRKIAFGGLFFFFTLFPVLGFVPITSAIVADRYAYIPSIGVYYIITLIFIWFYDRAAKQALLRVIFRAALIVILLFLSSLTWQRSLVWKDSLSLWEDSIRNNPGAPLAYYNLGNTYLDNAKEEMAITAYRESIRLNPYFADAHNNLACALRLAGNYEEALSSCRRSIAIAPGNSRVYYNLGQIYEDIGDKEEAIKAYSKAADVDPANLAARNNLAAIYADRADIDRAIGIWREIITVDPRFSTAHFNLAVFYYRNGEYDLAVEHCDKVTALGNKVDDKFLELLKPHRK
ncbi:MAG: tetratricopeptide repeat protein [Candidatus Omnitrophota bacterium]|jgi:tetratricopeptide (TPR) repeat protein